MTILFVVFSLRYLSTFESGWPVLRSVGPFTLDLQHFDLALFIILFIS